MESTNRFPQSLEIASRFPHSTQADHGYTLSLPEWGSGAVLLLQADRVGGSPLKNHPSYRRFIGIAWKLVNSPEVRIKFQYIIRRDLDLSLWWPRISVLLGGAFVVLFACVGLWA